jgi:hypothetical protein
MGLMRDRPKEPPKETALRLADFLYSRTAILSLLPLLRFSSHLAQTGWVLWEIRDSDHLHQRAWAIGVMATLSPNHHEGPGTVTGPSRYSRNNQQSTSLGSHQRLRCSGGNPAPRKAST